jgi:hypothetical protein
MKSISKRTICTRRHASLYQFTKNAGAVSVVHDNRGGSDKTKFHRTQSTLTSPSSSTSSSTSTEELIQFTRESTPVLLNSKEHVVGYLSRILNARVYDACRETELQDAKNLSSVRADEMTQPSSFTLHNVPPSRNKCIHRSRLFLLFLMCMSFYYSFSI